MNSKTINEKNKFGNSALMEASLSCQSEIEFAKILELFIANNSTIPTIQNIYGKHLEHLLAIRNYGNVLSYLIRANQVDATRSDKEGLTPIHNALLHGSIAALKVLVNEKTDFRFCSEKYGKEVEKYIYLQRVAGPIIVNSRLENIFHSVKEHCSTCAKTRM